MNSHTSLRVRECEYMLASIRSSSEHSTGTLPQCDDPLRVGLIGCLEGDCDGFIYAVADADAAHGHLIDNLHCAPMMKGQGLGRALIRGACREMQRRQWAADRPVHLFVRDGNVLIFSSFFCITSHFEKLFELV
jgi:hypothetical protein